MTSTGACCECLRLHKRAHQGQLNTAQSRHRKANPEQWAAYYRTGYDKNAEEYRKRAREYYQENKEARVNYQKKYYSDPEKRKIIRAYRKKVEATPEHIQKRRYKTRLRLSSDPKVNMANRMRCRIWQLLRRGKGRRSWTQIVGYDADTLIRHIERQFTDGMSWENMGQWHVDHILPVSMFSVEEIKECWALSNLRPLWSEENLKKNARREFLL